MYNSNVYLLLPPMGKFKNTLDTGALRVGNTIATPVRRWGEVGNALGNVLRQGKSSAKNTAEVGKQTVDALVDNFLNFSKVQGKWYQKLLKGWINLASACTRRPVMIAGAGVLSSLNQWIWKPFTKLAPGKLFKGLWNATRLFSKKKWFDFAQYDTHETWKDTWVNQRKEKHLGFFGTWWSAPAAETKEPEETKKVETPVVEAKKPEEPKNESKSESKSETPAPKEEKPTKEAAPEKKPSSIQDVKEEDKKKSEKKEKEEKEKNFPEWKTLPDKFKIEYKKEYDKTLKNNPTPQWIVARGKEAKMWDKPEEIIKNFKEKDPTFAGYMEEISNKAA